MAPPSHIRRTLAIVVREPIPQEGAEFTPGRRFAEGWAAFLSLRSAGEAGAAHDTVMAAGFAAAKAAWEAHQDAVIFNATTARPRPLSQVTVDRIVDGIRKHHNARMGGR